ncbi:DUF2490 domain-containing protein [Hymenobacter sp. NBH84]|uniref:DUF2490 domain-containing protein n=1 Tax=Hymenobacter sp. NBH84 TaxID=2596915 RepID=UPI0021560406|nr:DUF2490 domain-containing protein [Hymenobacter sp. NBH84]
MRPPSCLLLLLLCFIATHSRAQTQRNRIADHNTLGWLVYNGDNQISKKWQLHSELQLRRVHLGTDPQQLLARLGGIYQLSDRVKVSGGYTLLITYPYGDYPTAASGRSEPEHRLYEDVSLKDALGRLELTHRLRLEQRWQAQFVEKSIESWWFQNRIRYQLSLQLPLIGPTLDNQEPYLTAFDEIFISFGRNVQNNVFNQNRLAGGVGYRFSDHFRLDVQYLYQITQHEEDAPGTNTPVFEYNHGIRTVLAYDLDFTK